MELDEAIKMLEEKLIGEGEGAEQRRQLLSRIDQFKTMRRDAVNCDRQVRWVRASQKFTTFKTGHILATIQGLGRLDAKLMYEDQHFVRFGKASGPLEEMSEHFTLSSLWVMGAYELIRTLCYASHPERGIGFQTDYADDFQHLKRKFSRLRIILAKHEPEGRHRKTDAHFAMPGYNIGHGIAWQVAQDTWITRTELSDAMLALFETLPLYTQNR